MHTLGSSSTQEKRQTYVVREQDFESLQSLVSANGFPLGDFYDEKVAFFHYGSHGLTGVRVDKVENGYVVTGPNPSGRTSRDIQLLEMIGNNS